MTRIEKLAQLDLSTTEGKNAALLILNEVRQEVREASLLIQQLLDRRSNNEANEPT